MACAPACSDDAVSETAFPQGWFTQDGGLPQLLGTRCLSCGTYYFPRQSLFCRNPACAGESFEEVPLSRTGRLWSYTDAQYTPPPPYVAADPHQPFAVAAVELEREQMIVLGQVARGIGVEQLQVGMAMELVVETLSPDCVTWKWRPLR